MKKIKRQPTDSSVGAFLNLIRTQQVRNTTNLLDHETFLQTFNRREIPDAELIRDYIINHNQEAFEELYNRHKSPMMAYLYGILKSWEDAKDVFHNAWEVVLKSFSNNQYNEQEDFAGWFKSVCYRKASEWKKEKFRFYYGSMSLPENADLSFNPEQQTNNSLCESILRSAMDKLTNNEKQIVMLRVFQDIDFNDIAATKQITASAARGIYCKALKKLKNSLG